MTPHRTASREQWLSERLSLLAEEKALTRQSDELARKRSALPWVRIDKDYRFDTEQGPVSLVDLFGGRSQLLVYHFMFGPSYQAGCPSCSAIADGFNGTQVHLQNHDVAFWAVSRAPLAALLGYRERMGWHFPWASSSGSDFNFDFGASFTPEQQESGIVYNYQAEPPVPRAAIDDASIPSRATPDGASRGASSANTDVASYARERPGMSAFAMQDGEVFHTYSAYSRGLDALWNTYAWLDRAPLGRNEQEYWWRRHDDYDAPRAAACCSCAKG
ncbi:putative dithiol-disulfide oxidoreductase (DUF899 family) [Comamonas odontotermitis]|uniref:Dithiol-disulfide oxidoreductase (DUF899 family) n=1 Tax=Comamonas odontotermitis TaxID=379895 RepID=A0ABR6RGL7_9BURK|nr:DUF899 domain-containing protein [Comamonas odontotermitis]MBB6578302.1 putative dithiol-disulfide oxidoreductase (DUF899 family) [Comamonas odontotermitis]